MLDFRVNDLLPGESLSARPGTTIKIRATAFGHGEPVPLNKLEIVAHGAVIQSITHQDKGQSKEQLSIDMELPIDHGLWIVARCEAGPLQMAHTTPVYISVDDLGHLNVETAPQYLELSEQYLQELEEEIQKPHQWFDRRAWTYKDALQLRIDEARKILDEIGEKLN